MFPKIKKAVLVVFITCLIWVWADLSLDDVLEDQIITVVASRANPQLWVTLEGKPEIQIKANINGPAGKIRELSQKIDSGKEKIEVIFDAERQKMEAPDDYTLQDVRKFLAESKKIREYGLGVKSATPDSFKVKVVALNEKSLPIKCFDETDTEITGARITPDIITMRATDSITIAKVKLSALAEKKQARGGVIEKQAYIELSNGEIRYSDTPVKVELPMVQEDMKQYTISGTLGFIFSANLAGGYKVEFTKRPEIGTIPIIATDEAKAAYEDKAFEVLLEIQDDDVNKEEVARTLIYNFPLKYVREDKIRLKSDPIEAKFKLVPVTQNPGSTPTVPVPE